jgi:Asp-tRNA(Asn)/Glu-tRNA(Gln) amidotransferase A subunit family amidase
MSVGAIGRRDQPSATEWLRRLGHGECSSRELTEHYVRRAEDVNSELNALVGFEPELALIDAEHADKRRAAGDAAALLGLPITIKDALDVRGLVSTGGSYARAGHRPATDAAVVDRVRRAGAVILGKTNVPEYSWSFETDNAIYGRTNNPFDLDRTPGGSSGGEGALLGADASPLGIGTDGGGSIRVPAHFCGICGLRPSAGRVPETGIWPPSRASGMMDMYAVGPMGRCVADLALALEVIEGPDWMDPYVRHTPGGDWRGVKFPDLRVATFTHDGLAVPSAATCEAVAAAAAALERAGARVSNTAPAGLAGATQLFFKTMAADGGAQARHDIAPANGKHHPQLAALLDDVAPLAVDAGGFFELQREIFAFRARVRTFLTEYPLLICPVCAERAPEHGLWRRAPLDSGVYNMFNYTAIFSLAGVPVVVVPAGEDEHLPIGVQVVAQVDCEHLALAAAGVIEAELGGFARFQR